MKWLDRLTSWFTEHIVEPLVGTKLPESQFDVEVPRVNPLGPVKPQPIDFDRSEGRYVPLLPTHTLTEDQLEDAKDYFPEGLTPNQENWVYQMLYEDMRRGADWSDLMDDLIFDFWEFYRSNYGPGAA